ncbi:MAG: UV DNA damage repair endonuclease UvsE [Anaerolineae bacterium]
MDKQVVECTFQNARRLGFSIRVMGRPDLPAWVPGRSGPLTLGLSLVCLRDILLYCQAQGIRMYRMHCGLAPAPESAVEMTALWRTYEGEAVLLGDLVRSMNIRLSFHPYSLVILNTPDDDRVWRSIAHLESQVRFLDSLALGPEAVITLHVGGVYGDVISSCERFVRRYNALPDAIRRRIVLENDDHRFSVAELLYIHEKSGVPLVFDWQHHHVLNPQNLPWQEALTRCLATWPSGITPKVHLSSPRTELRSENGRIKVPSWTEHSDYMHPFECIALLRASQSLPFDIMLECKARDLAVIKLRQDLVRFAPDLAATIR